MACLLFSLRNSSGVSFLGGGGGNGPPGGAGLTGSVNEVPRLVLAGCERSAVVILGMDPEVAARWPSPGCMVEPDERPILPPPFLVGDRFWPWW